MAAGSHTGAVRADPARATGVRRIALAKDITPHNREAVAHLWAADSPIEALALSGRTHNLVTSAYYWRERGELSDRGKTPRTIGELAAKRSMELMRVPGLGKVALREIREALARHDLYLRDERPIAAHRRPEEPPGLAEFEERMMAPGKPKIDAIDRALIRALLRYVRRLERDAAEGSFW